MNRKTHAERADAVLAEAIRQCTDGYSAASGSLIRKRIETCLATALATCQEDAIDIYERIDEER